ncbi:Ku protein [Tunturiibacter empetritectus]|uniref:Non-homologous end joining protein Ku n=1 Tax=Tunturiibacter lichenicola TaxID=2051959 RepID=A0A852V7C7_9BACT|nr:Ku protein [Edaphobacter lichenicola]NYF88898.1 DNA end-binding protein Ku [Edaphobacter lichenicola]
MPTRPTWSGSIQISLVSISVNIFPATNPGRQVEFHQIDRKTHKRVHHQNVDESGEVEKADIVKGFEYAKDKYIEIDPDELKALRLPTATTMQIKQFVKADEISSALYDRPYFVAPKDEVQAKALSIMRKALDQTDTLGIGEIAFSGREHLVAIGAPLDPKQKGLMLYMLRYADELRDPKSSLSGVKEASVDSDELSLAKQLIAKSLSKFDLSAYQNDYEAAVKKLVEAKRKGRPLPEPEPTPAKNKVVNIMDALRNSLAESKPKTSVSKKTSRRKTVAV